MKVIRAYIITSIVQDTSTNNISKHWSLSYLSFHCADKALSSNTIFRCLKKYIKSICEINKICSLKIRLIVAIFRKNKLPDDIFFLDYRFVYLRLTQLLLLSFYRKQKMSCVKKTKIPSVLNFHQAQFLHMQSVKKWN